MLEWPLPRERNEAVCTKTARCIDALLVSLARGCGARGASIGKYLRVLPVGDRVPRLSQLRSDKYAPEEKAPQSCVKEARLAVSRIER